MTTSISSEALKLWMGICSSRKKEYSLKSRIDLLEKTNTKPYFIQYDDIPTFKLNYILDAQNNSKNFMILSSQKSLKIGPKTAKILQKLCRNINKNS